MIGATGSAAMMFQLEGEEIMNLGGPGSGGGVGKDDGKNRGDPPIGNEGKAAAETRKHKKKTDGNAAKRVAAAETASEAGDPALKKCTGFCGKKKLLTEFHAEQGKCKDCVRDLRAYWRLAEKQGCLKDMRDLEQTDPQIAKDVQKEFVRERQKATAAEGKLKFGITAYKKTLLAAAGDRKENKKTMMWEGEWLEEAKKAKYGYLTKEEAENQWTSWLNDQSVARDNLGPRGYLRLAVFKNTTLADFTEVRQEREISQEERLSKKQAESDEVMQARTNMVMNVGSGHVVAAAGDLREKAQATACDLEQMSAPSLMQNLQRAEKKRKSSGKKKGKEKETEADGEEQSEDESDNDGAGDESESEGGEGGKSGSKPPKKEKWFDAETKCRKAERAWEIGCDSIENSIVGLAKDCDELKAAIASAVGSESQLFQEERRILDRRMQWLQALLDGDEALKAMLDSQAAEEASAQQDSKTTSADLSALVRAGPCRDYQNLKALETLRRFGASFRSCTSNQGIKDMNEEGAGMKKTVGTLMSAAKAAKTDLASAQKRWETNRKKEEERAKKAEKAAAAAAAKEGKGGKGQASQQGVQRNRVSTQTLLLGGGPANSGNFDLWQGEEYRILSGCPCNPNKPFICSGVALPQQVNKKVAEFGQVFANSSLRVTEGRALAPLGDASLKLQKALDEILPPGPPGDGQVWHTVLPESGEDAAHADHKDALASPMRMSMFGIAACSTKAGAVEVGMMPCVRVFTQGSFAVAIYCPSTFSGGESRMAQAQETMTQGNVDEIKALAESGQLLVGTVGPGDLLYLPAACITTYKALALDILGVRVGVLSRDFLPRLTSFHEGCVQDLPPAVAKPVAASLFELERPAYTCAATRQVLDKQTEKGAGGAAAAKPQEAAPEESAVAAAEQKAKEDAAAKAKADAEAAANAAEAQEAAAAAAAQKAKEDAAAKAQADAEAAAKAQEAAAAAAEQKAKEDAAAKAKAHAEAAAKAQEAAAAAAEQKAKEDAAAKAKADAEAAKAQEVAAAAAKRKAEEDAAAKAKADAEAAKAQEAAAAAAKQKAEEDAAAKARAADGKKRKSDIKDWAEPKKGKKN